MQVIKPLGMQHVKGRREVNYFRCANYSQLKIIHHFNFLSIEPVTKFCQQLFTLVKNSLICYKIAYS